MMEAMKLENLFITISPKIRKQLELNLDKDSLTFYEALGLPHNCSSEEMTRSYNRSRELLSHLKYHPQYKEEAEAVFQLLTYAVSILENPPNRLEYDTALRNSFDEMQITIEEAFLLLIRMTAREGSLTPEQKKDLLPYATRKKIPSAKAQALMDQIPTLEKSDAPPIAEPPQLTAPLPRYLETPAFQILLVKNTPLMEKLQRLRCSHCNTQVPITYLACSCGSLLRGKMICLDCASVFPCTALHCSCCARESNLMLELTDEDTAKSHALMELYIHQGQLTKALETGKDLLSVRPGNEKVRNLLESLKEKVSKEETGTEYHDYQQQGLEAWKKNKTFQAIQLLHRASEEIDLSPEVRQALALATDLMMKRMTKILIPAFLLVVFLLSLSLTAFLWGSNHNSRGIISLAVGLALFSVLLFFTGIGILLLARKYKRKTDNILKDKCSSSSKTSI